MYTPVKLICFTTLLTATPVLPHNIEQPTLGEYQFNDSQQQLLAKKESKKEGCGSSPTPGCSRRDSSSHKSQRFSVG